MGNPILSDREKRRFANQIAFDEIGLAGQERIKNARILVIGTGGKGTAAMQSLISAGVGYLGVSDDTLIEEETLSRQSLYNDTDLGKQKAIVTKQYLQSRNTLTQIKVHNIRLTVSNLASIVSQYDIIIDATNNFESHYAIFDSATQTKKPLVFGHIENNISYITSFSPINFNDLKGIFPPDNSSRFSDQDNATPVILVNSLAGNVLANEAISLSLKGTSQLDSKLLKIKLTDYTFDFESI